ncbi:MULTISPECIES: J domain-containing protein [Paenarthrobacter]|uniref:J domain-containing protein n=1 Tax=Paenarthrobacter TaxID=1742992 RepID=UPI001408271E|nr:MULTISPECIES: J domain-containing protein [Paenarthrobacter]MCX8456449.1 J domain-containing protein [Paenarthrobacter ureafaciens]MCY0972248.1 J domain-containing protein [Paenarthrobacter ureafaciens]QOT17901.1 J domain-containing protein [Paenarthrobacter sp. YJN-5]
MGNSQPDYYAILGVEPTASAREITRAYRSLLRRHHPDTRQADHDGGASEASNLHRLHAIMQAFVVLSDPVRRAEYDRTRSGSPRIGAGTPVNVRIHRTTAATEPHAAGEDFRRAPSGSGPDRSEPLIFGPTRWSPLRGHPTPRRRT